MKHKTFFKQWSSYGKCCVCLGSNLLKTYIEYVETNRINAIMDVNIRMLLEEALNINIFMYKSVYAKDTKEVV